MTPVADKKRQEKFFHLFSTISLALFLLVSLFSWSGVAFPSEPMGNEACLQCHGARDILRLSREKRLGMVIPTPGSAGVQKEGLTLHVDYAKFLSTAHRKLNCIYCHTSIKYLPHPQRLGTVSCAQCHEEIAAQYEKSKHAKISQILCFECHNPHAATSFRKLSQQERMGICLRCHEKDGHQWLPQRDLHFQYLECTVCHAPQAEKGIVFYLQRLGKGGETERLDYGEVAKLLGMGRPDLAKLLDSDSNGFLEDREVLSFLKSLKERNPRENIELGVRVLVLKPSHNYTKGAKAKDCSLCHSSRAEFYAKLIMEIPGSGGGGIRTLPMEKSILTGIHTIPVTSSFYLLGEGRIGKRDIADLLFILRKIGYKWLDVIGILFIVGSLGFVGIHAFLRIVTIGMRRKRRHKEG